MKVGDSVRKSIDDWEQAELDASMIHACNAVDGTAKRLHPSMGSNRRFTAVLRDNYHIFGPMAAPGVNLSETIFPVGVPRPTHRSGHPDIADLVYGIHRCTHGHGEELPDSFTLIPEAAGPPRRTSLYVSREGRVHLSDRVIFGLLAVAVLSSVNADQRVPDGYFLSLGTHRLPINDWWGRADDFASLVAQERLPNVKLDFGEWIHGRSRGASAD